MARFRYNMPGHETIVDLAKSYAHQIIELGKSPTKARDYLRDNFPASPAEIRRAIYEAERGMAVGRALDALPTSAKISEALQGKHPPSAEVGVRVQVTRYRESTGNWATDRVNTLYVQVPWDATKEDVIQRILGWFNATESGGSGPALAWEVSFVGPTWWPGESQPIYGGL